MGTKLHQIIALVGGRKTRIQKLLTDIHHGWKDDRLAGISKVYQPINEDGEVFPPENKPVQVRVDDVIAAVTKPLAAFYDLVATQESGNQQAWADIEVEGTALAAAVPVGALLFLEKQLVDLLTLAKELPVLSPDREWAPDDNKGCWATLPEWTVKTQKRPEVIVKYDATPEHPAQTEIFTADKTVGHWTTSHFSGALPAVEKTAIIARIVTVIDAVKVARSRANDIEIEPVHYGTRLLAYIFTSK